MPRNPILRDVLTVCRRSFLRYRLLPASGALESRGVTDGDAHREHARDQCASIPAAQTRLQFEVFETIHTENRLLEIHSAFARCDATNPDHYHDLPGPSFWNVDAAL